MHIVKRFNVFNCLSTKENCFSFDTLFLYKVATFSGFRAIFSKRFLFNSPEWQENKTINNYYSAINSFLLDLDLAKSRLVKLSLKLVRFIALKFQTPHKYMCLLHETVIKKTNAGVMSSWLLFQINQTVTEGGKVHTW